MYPGNLLYLAAVCKREAVPAFHSSYVSVTLK